MKTLLALIASLIALSSTADDLTLTNTFKVIGKTKNSCPPNFFYTGWALFTNKDTIPTNQWFFPTTNVHTLTLTSPANPGAVVQAVSSTGLLPCGFSSLTWTDQFYGISGIPDYWRFAAFWSNNVTVPSNGTPFIVTVTGFRTNAP